MIWGIIALVGLLMGAVYWIWKQSRAKASAEEQLRHEHALNAQKGKIMETMIRSMDRDVETHKKLDKLREVKTIGELVHLYRSEFSE